MSLVSPKFHACSIVSEERSKSTRHSTSEVLVHEGECSENNGANY
jgi:hypothetical protein